MKIVNIFLLVTIISCSKNDSKADPATNLNGEWIGKGYQCPTGTIISEEIVKIVHNGDSITATKITGDECVPAGNITFRGRHNQSKNQYDIVWNTGNPWSPVCCTSDGILRITDKNKLNTFSTNGAADDVYFIRK